MPTLNWLGDQQAKHTARRVPYRLLETVSQHGDINAQNWLIQGDNLDALKALLPFYAGKVKCIFIDPPYNTKSAFEHYDDNLEHSQWLSMMYPRLELLRELLSEDGFIIVHIDDSESHYLKVMLDEVFNRKNYHLSIYVQVRYGNKTLAEDSDYQKIIEQAFVYSKGIAKPYKEKEDYSIDKFVHKINELAPGEIVTLGGKKVEIFKPGSFSIEEGEPSLFGLKGTWATGSLIKQKASSGEFLHLNISPRKEIDGLGCLYKVYGIGEDGLGYRYFTGPKKATATKGLFYSGIPLKRVEELKLGMAKKEKPILNFYDWSGSFGNCRQEGGVDFRAGKKPEAYVKKMLDLFSQPGDLVLDSFLGSGSTAAVAHKTNRQYIGIEMGPQAETHCLSRLESVIGGENTGISETVNWLGGGGFRYMKLGEPVFLDDGSINPDIRFNTLASYVWFLETGQPHTNAQFASPLLGITGEDDNAVAYVLLFNGILGDRRANGGNVLTSVLWPYLQSLAPEHKGRWVIYGEAARMTEARRRSHQISFKQIPYDIRMK